MFGKHGAVKDKKKARALFQKSAKLGYSVGMTNWALCCLDKPKLAAAWYERAAALGDAGAMFELGRLYAGIAPGLKRDL